jgi:Xaa-Pro aminopeptidase
MNKQFFISNRKNLLNLMENNSLAIFFGSQLPSGHMPVEFVQKKNFYYLTGLNIPNSILILYKKGKEKKEVVFIERNIPELEVWLGEKMSKENAKEISGIETVYHTDEFERHLHSYALSSNMCYYDYKTHPINFNLSNELVRLNLIKQHYPTLTIKTITPFLSKLRSKKSKEEIENIKKAISYTNSGIRNIWEYAHPGMMEYELEAYFKFECIKRGERQLAFPPIVASGENATILHYEKNASKIGENELILIDVGAKYQEYDADISRTFPASGRFNKRQREVYNKVLQVQKKIIDCVSPDVSINELQEKTIELITEALFSLNLITKKEEYKKYYMHSVSHHLGLDAHDLGDREKKLYAGNVITVEPGIYIKEEKIGVRIEDDILITKNGCDVLSSMIPKEIEEIERIMAKRK